MSAQASKMHSSADDVWDDTLLIKQYDDSLKLGKEEVARRIAGATNKQAKEKSPPHDYEIIKKPSNDATQKDDPAVAFKVGDYCRATYTDGIDYEAKIMDIDKDDGTCLIKYIGYNNEEYCNYSDLIESWGKKVRKEQFFKAKLGDDSNKTPKTDPQSAKKSNRRIVFDSPEPEHSNVGKMKSKNGLSGFMHGASIPPPPPMPPMLNQMSEDSENLSLMLMSWYMSGYYTGLYQGQKISSKNSNTKRKS